VFTVRVLEGTQVGPYPGAITQVTGEAHIMSTNQWVLEQSDPFPNGFFLR
jgi:proline racemase